LDKFLAIGENRKFYSQLVAARSETLRKLDENKTHYEKVTKVVEQTTSMKTTILARETELKNALNRFHNKIADSYDKDKMTDDLLFLLNSHDQIERDVLEMQSEPVAQKYADAGAETDRQQLLQDLNIQFKKFAEAIALFGHKHGRDPISLPPSMQELEPDNGVQNDSNIKKAPEKGIHSGDK
jgi:hypothetical protein